MHHSTHHSSRASAARDENNILSETAKTAAHEVEEEAETLGDAVSSQRDEPVYIKKGRAGYLATMLALFSAGFATFALLYCVQPMMPIFSAAFGIDAASSSLVLSTSTAMLAIGMLITGPISDAIGRKSVMSVALVGAAVFTLLGAFMPSWEGVLITRALVGLSLSGLCAVAMTYLNEEIHPGSIGVSMGLYIGGNAIGGMSGRLISGIMVDFVSWRVALGTLGMIALIAALTFIRILPPSRHFQPRSLKPRSLAAGFIGHFKDRGLPWLFLESFLLMGSFVTLFNYIGYRLLGAPYHYSQAVIGLLSIVYLSGIYSSAWAGSLADKLGRNRVFWTFIALMLAGLGLTLFQPVSVILTGMLLFTFGFFAAHSTASSWIGKRATQAKGQASSLYLFSYYVGSSLAGTLGGVFWHYGGWNGVGGFIAILLVIALAVGLHLKRLPVKQASA